MSPPNPYTAPADAGVLSPARPGDRGATPWMLATGILFVLFTGALLVGIVVVATPASDGPAAWVVLVPLLGVVGVVFVGRGVLLIQAGLRLRRGRLRAGFVALRRFFVTSVVIELLNLTATCAETVLRR